MSKDTKKNIWKILVDIRIALAVLSQNLFDLKLRNTNIPGRELSTWFGSMKAGTDCLIGELENELNTSFTRIEPLQQFLSSLRELETKFQIANP